jgi:hypothetical protein
VCNITGSHVVCSARAHSQILNSVIVSLLSCVLSRDSAVGIRAGQSRSCTSSPGRGRNFPFSMPSRPVLRPVQPPIQLVPGVKRPEREHDHSPPNYCQGQESVNLYTRSHTRLHGVVLIIYVIYTTFRKLALFILKVIYFPCNAATDYFNALIFEVKKLRLTAVRIRCADHATPSIRKS